MAVTKRKSSPPVERAVSFDLPWDASPIRLLATLRFITHGILGVSCGRDPQGNISAITVDPQTFPDGNCSDMVGKAVQARVGTTPIELPIKIAAAATKAETFWAILGPFGQSWVFRQSPVARSHRAALSRLAESARPSVLMQEQGMEEVRK